MPPGTQSAPGLGPSTDERHAGCGRRVRHLQQSFSLPER